MGNRVGVIFHEDWKEFSPLMYSHYGAELISFEMQDFIKEYYKENDIKDYTDGHKYNPCHMMVGFIQFIDKDIHIRIENLEQFQIEKLKSKHEYPNCFDGGCLIINVSRKHYGEIISN